MNVIIGVPSHNVAILVVAGAVDGHDHLLGSLLGPWSRV
jgi:hypothetical protein